MLILDDDAFWLDLPEGVRVKLRPIETPAVLRAQEAGRKAWADGKAVEAANVDDVQFAFVRSLVNAGVVEWEGVGDKSGVIQPTKDTVDDDGVVTPGTITRLLGWPPAYATLEREYTAPVQSGMAEKKGSSPSPDSSSTLTAAKATAKAASPSTDADVETAPAS